MPIVTTGTARIRHRETGEIYEIEADDLEWEAVAGSERQMGPETEHAAVVHHPALGEIAWRLWEYPIGAENYQQQDLSGHELVGNFEVNLVHEPDDDGERDEEGELLSPRAAVEEMKDWFYRKYEDPAQSLPYNSREGGYQWIRGGPYTVLESLEKRFGTDYPFGLLEEVAQEIVDESGGLDEWSPTDNPELDDPLDEFLELPSAEERRLAAQRVQESARQLEALLAPLIQIERDTERFGDADLPGIGHNGPPSPVEELGLPPIFFMQLGVDTEQLSEAVARTEVLLGGRENSAEGADVGAEPEDSNRVLARAIAANTEAVRENSALIRKNLNLVEESTGRLKTLKDLAIGGIVIGAAGTVIDGALTKVGEMLVENGVPLLAPLGPAAMGYLDMVVAKLTELTEAASHFIGMLPPIF